MKFSVLKILLCSSIIFSGSASAYFPTPQPKEEILASRIATIQVGAEQGNQEAQYLYGLLLLSGRIVDKDPVNGFLWLTRAATEGQKKAQKAVADLAFEGQIVPRDLALAEKWYLKLDNSWAHFRLGFIYAAGGDGIKSNCGKAVNEFLKAGDVASKNNAVWILSTCPESKYRNAKKAIMIADQLKHHAPNDFAIFDNLAAAYAEYGKFDKAIHYQQKAITLSRQQSSKDTPSMIKRLKLYEEGKPFREVISLP
ncbi:sel1 repeat family protein [Shewanella sp. 202IG2-18]|uniref:SEL1-like repeat protein n=1 Tax=Parashewanella hymeniacidonis TaxID=2807618 RepID=UPI0019607D8F|nr:SEL1-like repeat protein [Parashewanella hymeniacidonis]MBM7070824.1 sel1 repeat family protein [Parashewanella hymeniacidonis]